MPSLPLPGPCPRPSGPDPHLKKPLSNSTASPELKTTRDLKKEKEKKRGKKKKKGREKKEVGSVFLMKRPLSLGI